VHTYRLTPLGLWERRSSGLTPSRSWTRWCRYSRYAVPHALLVDVADTMDRYGRLQLIKHPTHGLVLVSLDRAVLEEVLRQKEDRAATGRAHRHRHGRRPSVRARDG
jgi:DNA excision repair protein ERCC-3